MRLLVKRDASRETDDRCRLRFAVRQGEKGASRAKRERGFSEQARCSQAESMQHSTIRMPRVRVKAHPRMAARHCAVHAVFSVHRCTFRLRNFPNNTLLLAVSVPTRTEELPR